MLSVPQRVVNFNQFPLEKREKMIEQSLKMIAKGKMCVVIDCTAVAKSLSGGQPKILKKLNFPVKMNLLEFFLTRLKDLGSLVVRKFGKGYTSNREPILPIFCVNEADIDAVENNLLSENYYGYKGMLCFCTVSSKNCDFV